MDPVTREQLLWIILVHMCMHGWKKMRQKPRNESLLVISYEFWYIYIYRPYPFAKK
jgi:hypothetical protein